MAVNNAKLAAVVDAENPAVMCGYVDNSESSIDFAGRANWLRAAVLGANDGLVSTASLMLGVSAVKPDARAMVVSGFAGLLAGACSMAIGEYVSVCSQRDVEIAELDQAGKRGGDDEKALAKPSTCRCGLSPGTGRRGLSAGFLRRGAPTAAGRRVHRGIQPAGGRGGRRGDVGAGRVRMRGRRAGAGPRGEVVRAGGGGRTGCHGRHLWVHEALPSQGR
uniref:Vacuolar iron transporter n=1 Tax=Triticum urartu TaxID=4572 RepID=A0A8R7PJE5_TRIUA